MGYELCINKNLLKFVSENMEAIRVVLSVIPMEDKNFVTARKYDILMDSKNFLVEILNRETEYNKISDINYRIM